MDRHRQRALHVRGIQIYNTYRQAMRSKYEKMWFNATEIPKCLDWKRNKCRERLRSREFQVGNKLVKRSGSSFNTDQLDYIMRIKERFREGSDKQRSNIDFKDSFHLLQACTHSGWFLRFASNENSKATRMTSIPRTQCIPKYRKFYRKSRALRSRRN